MRRMFADAELARRITEQDRAYWGSLSEAARTVGAVTGETFLDLGGTVAFFAGDGSPVTQANGRFAAADIDAVQAFYRDRTKSWVAILTPFDDPASLSALLTLGGKPEGWESVLYRPLDESLSNPEAPTSLEIREVALGLLQAWSDVALRGFFGENPTSPQIELARIMELAPEMRRYLAFWDGEPAAAASLSLGCGVAVLGGMSTLPAFRGRGLQSALIRRRLQDAQTDADLATMGATPGSSSQRNAERQGFRLAWTQLSLRVPAQPDTAA
jgi:GNAT superfamily N-acetyltransferase